MIGLTNSFSGRSVALRGSPRVVLGRRGAVVVRAEASSESAAASPVAVAEEKVRPASDALPRIQNTLLSMIVCCWRRWLLVL